METDGLEPNYSRYSILFVEDEDITRHYFARICEPEFQVISAENVLEALEILEEKHDEIAILLTDQRMPGPRGGDLLVTAKNKYPHIVRMLTTAYMDLDEAIQSVNEGEIFRYLEKPWDVEKLRSSLFDGMHLFLAREKQRDLLRFRRQSLFALSTRIADQVRYPLQRITTASKLLGKPSNQKIFAGKHRALQGELDSINGAISEIDRECRKAMMFIDMLQLNFDEEADKQEFFRECQMQDCVQEALARCALDPEHKASIKLDKKTDFSFFGSKIMMVHVFINLITRAIQAIESNSEHGVIEVSLAESDDLNQVVVRDNGANEGLLDPRILLERPYDLNAETHFDDGVSLSFCKNAIEQMGGSIHCMHDAGRSTQFNLYLPAISI